MPELSDDLKKDLKKLADANKRKKATTEDLAKIIHPYLPAEVQIQEESIFMQRARMVLKPPPPEPEPTPIVEPQPEPIAKKKPQLSALEKVIVWFTTKLETLSRRLEQGHDSGINADKLDGLHGDELVVRAANMANRGRGGGTLTTDHGNLTGLDHDDHTQYVPVDGVARQLADAGYPNALLLSGIRAMAALIDTGDYGVIGTHNTFHIGDASHWCKYIRTYYIYGTIWMQGSAATNLFLTPENSARKWVFAGYDGGAFQTCATLTGGGGTPEWSIERAGDITMLATKSLDAYTNAGYLKPRRLSQSAQPTPQTGELLMWRDTDDDKTYLVYEDPDVGTRKDELA